MHIRFRGRTSDDNKTPVEKVVPAEMLGIQHWNNKSYSAEVYYGNGKDYKAYSIGREEYERIGKLLEKNK